MTETLLFDAALLAPAIARGAVVLTPNRRLASRIRLALASGRAVAPAAPVFAIGDWIEQLWQQMIARADSLAAGLWVLSSAQELALWEQAVRTSDTPLMRPGQAAALAQSAYRTLALWQQLPLTAALRDECAAQPDSALFVEWADYFASSCDPRQAIAVAERDRRVADAALQKRLHLPAYIVVVGFDDMPPLYRALLRCVGDCSELELPSRLQHAVGVGFESLEKQLQAAALWAQRELQKNPRGPFAIVVPDLNHQRALVERVLLDVLTPEHVLPQTPRALPPLNFSSGEALAQMPLIRCALQLLELAADAIERETLLQLLSAPFHSCADDACSDKGSALVELIEKICALRTTQVRAAQLRHCADAVAKNHAVTKNFAQWPFAPALQQLAERVRRERWHSAKYSAQAWSQLFSDTLLALGWPGTRTLDSVEYQQHVHWQKMLIEFVRYDQIGGPLDFATAEFDFKSALARLRQLAQSQVFQPKTPDTPLQVLGVLEAAGLQFQGLWLCDMGDDRWPAMAAPHALLPRDLQRRLRMPRCDAEREFAIAQRLAQSLLASAPNVVVSYQNESDEVARRISPLFATLREIDSNELFGGDLSALLPATARHRRNSANFSREEFFPGNAPTLTVAETARGGSALFKDQAACPFRAFAARRLNAYPLDEPVAGLDAAERGSILHAALELIWRELQNQAALIVLDENAQNALIHRASTQALQDFAAHAPHRLGLRFMQLETQRLQRLLNAWLDVERQRGEFTVHVLEHKARAEFHGLPLQLRVDRIDQLRDGRFLIIDYKTKNANCSINEWLGERPDEPQLPLYAQVLESDATLAGVAFAQVRLEKPQLIGAGDIEQSSLEKEPGFEMPSYFSDDEPLHDWSELQARWRSVLENLAQQFIDGYAVVDPKARNTCDFCELDSICRVAHTTSDDDAPLHEGAQ